MLKKLTLLIILLTILYVSGPVLANNRVVYKETDAKTIYGETIYSFYYTDQEYMGLCTEDGEDVYLFHEYDINGEPKAAYKRESDPYPTYTVKLLSYKEVYDEKLGTIRMEPYYHETLGSGVSGDTIVVPEYPFPLEEGKVFRSWRLEPMGDEVLFYRPGDTLTIPNEDSTLVAILYDVDEPTRIYGDATGDGEVNSKDVVRLRKYLAEYDYETGISTVEIYTSADATGDGNVNGKDVVRLRKYLAEYDYETGKSTVILGPDGQ